MSSPSLRRRRSATAAPCHPSLVAGRLRTFSFAILRRIEVVVDVCVLDLAGEAIRPNTGVILVVANNLGICEAAAAPTMSSSNVGRSAASLVLVSSRSREARRPSSHAHRLASLPPARSVRYRARPPCRAGRRVPVGRAAPQGSVGGPTSHRPCRPEVRWGALTLPAR